VLLVSRERVEYWLRRIDEAHTWKTFIAISELSDIAEEIKNDEELTEEEKKEVFDYLNFMYEYVATRPEEFD
jgi:hypothetical protein